MHDFAAPSMHALRATLDDCRSPVAKSMRAAYFLRHHYDKASDESIRKEAVEILGAALLNKSHGALLRHEFAYVLGQMKAEAACDALERTLDDKSDNVMVRHECGEALGAIGSLSSLECLKRNMLDESALEEVAQTCEVAVNFIAWQQKGEDYETSDSAPVACACMIAPYNSTDPAPPSPAHVDVPSDELGRMLRDTSLELFERYKCMFSLRNRGGEDCVSQLGITLVDDHSSALLRHEVAYVLGQMQHPSSVEALTASLRRAGEHAMVRHEAAEALGAIKGRWDECEKILTEFLQDRDEVVRESCQVALDAIDYFGNRDPSSIENTSNNKETIEDSMFNGPNGAAAVAALTADLDEPKPKKAVSAYMFYLKRNRKQMLDQNKKQAKPLKPSEVMKLISTKWASLDADKRVEYEQMAEQDSKRYEQEMDAYNSKCTSEDTAKQGIFNFAAQKASKARQTGAVNHFNVQIN